MRLLAGASLLASLTLPVVADRSAQSFHKSTPVPLRALLERAQRDLAAFEYDKARSSYLSGLRDFGNLRDFDRASLLIGLGNCELLARRYAEALHFYEKGAAIAETAGLTEHELIIAGNRVTVYRRMADTASALRLMRTVERLLPRTRNPLVLSQFATVMRDIAFDRALEIYKRALDLAAANGDRFTESVIWNQIGVAFDERNDLNAADRAFTEAFRLRVLNGRTHLQPSYFYLGRLRWKQGNLQAAIRLLNNALTWNGSLAGRIQPPYVHHALALAYKSAGQNEQSLTQFRAAVRTMRAWRLEILPAESFRISSERFSQRIFADFVQTGMHLYGLTRNQSLGMEMLETAEDSRNWLAREVLVHQSSPPPAYVEALSRYRSALARSVGASDPSAETDAARALAALTDVEVRIGFETKHRDFSHQISEKSASGNALLGLRTKLKPDELLLSFHLGAESSFVWAVTSEAFSAHRIANRSLLQDQVASFRNALLDRKEFARRAGEMLAKSIFGPIPSDMLRKRKWIVSPDGPLFAVPFGALPGKGGWLGEHHAIRISSNVFRHGPSEADPVTDDFVAIADPVYNRADSRFNGSPRESAAELPRLHGSAREAASCARSWGRDSSPEVLTGRDAGREQLLTAAARGPGILHVAAHTVPHPTMADQVLLAIGLQPSGQMDYFSPADIAFRRLPVGVVTLSSCASGRGTALPGLGLFGLTRAWLMAGATAVVASHWPIADDSGDLLAAMYQRLGQTTGPLSPSKVADALQAAQLRMIQAGGWRSDPVYWSAFAVIGKD